METLENLVVCARQGDNDAYEQIVRRFQDMAVGYGYATLGDMQQAQDIAQEAFISAYYNLPSLRDPAAFPGWFRRIVHTQIHRQLREGQPVLVALDGVPEIEAPGPITSVEQDEMTDALCEAIMSLPESQRSAVTLFYISEYSQKEIAGFLEIPLATVKTRLHHARKRLKTRITTIMNLPEQRPSKDNQFTEKVMRLFDATKSGDIDKIKTLLAEDRSLAQASGFIQTAVWGADAHALHVAVMHGRKDIVDLLLAHGADINVRDEKYRFTALMHAIDLADFMPEYAELKMVDFLLERGAEKDVWACWWLGDTEGVKTWLDQEPSLVNQVGPGPSTLLSFTKDIEAIDFLLGYGADPLRTYAVPGWWEKKSALQTMAFRGQFEAVRHLLDHTGIDIDIFLASIMGELETVQTMFTDNSSLVQVVTPEDHVLGGGFTALHLSAQAGHADMVRLLLEHGADINARGYKGYTPLHFAISFGPKKLLDPLPTVEQTTQGIGIYRLLTDMPRLLIERGADLTARDSQGQTPLALADSRFEDETDRSDVIAILKDATPNS